MVISSTRTLKSVSSVTTCLRKHTFVSQPISSNSSSIRNQPIRNRLRLSPLNSPLSANQSTAVSSKHISTDDVQFIYMLEILPNSELRSFSKPCVRSIASSAQRDRAWFSRTGVNSSSSKYLNQSRRRQIQG